MRCFAYSLYVCPAVKHIWQIDVHSIQSGDIHNACDLSKAPDKSFTPSRIEDYWVFGMVSVVT